MYDTSYLDMFIFLVMNFSYGSEDMWWKGYPQSKLMKEDEENEEEESRSKSGEKL